VALTPQVMITDPGAVPLAALPATVSPKDAVQSVCGKCDSYKPPRYVRHFRSLPLNIQR
jgi:hypothetical protein